MSGLPALDYSNPIKTITAKGTYTVPEDCYLVGSMAAWTKDVTLLINNIRLGTAIVYGNDITALGPFVLKVRKDDIIIISSNATTEVNVSFALLKSL